jgi:dihydrolipoamide dehydrogenase
MKAIDTKLLVIGGGPGGYVAAVRAGQNGIATTLVESDALGGTCLNVGCIPSKALLHAADLFQDACRQASKDGHLGIRVTSPTIALDQTVAWKDNVVAKLTSGVDMLLKRQGIGVLSGMAEIVDGKSVLVHGADGVTKVTCEHLLLATGSTPVELPAVPFGAGVISSSEALSLKAVPGRLAVVGAGYIGLELGTAFRKLGSHVTVIEARDRILPTYDEELTRPILKSLKALGVDIRIGSRVVGFDPQGHHLRVEGADGKPDQVQADVVLVAVGRRPMTRGMNLESLGLAMNGQAISVDDCCRTSMRNVWAIGDLTGEPMLAHRAMAQAEVAADVIAGKKRTFNPAVVPAVCFTDPELVVVGQSAEQARSEGVDVTTATFPLAGNGRALTLGATGGFVRVVARTDSHQIVGWQAVGRGVAELSTAFAHSIEMCERLQDAAATIHAHPTLGEAVQEAAHKALGHALHA